jgi:hypothetical protein
MNLIDITAANTPAAAAAYKGRPAILTLTDGTTVEGDFLSVNSKGWNVIVDGVTVSRGFARTASVEIMDYTGDEADVADELDDMDEDTEADYIADMYESGEVDLTDGEGPQGDATEMDALVAELDGATTAEVAEIFGTSAKELRVTLRALGMGVGKGHRYHLTAEQITVVRTALEGAPTA